jgi:2-(1,2-epoxy-1,2-dihydrophenyl)acetyl-CoA isomerase
MADVVLEIDDGLARLRLDRPDASNAMSLELVRDLHDAVLAIHADPGARAVLLTGAGPNFCAGGDVKAFAAKGEELPAYIREVTTWLHAAAEALMHLDVPVVLLVQGWATGGGGMGLVCCADLVLAGESARFVLGATRVGMAPDTGASVTLGQLVGHRRALELALTNRVLSADEALHLGLVTRVVPDDALSSEGEALARELAAGPTRALGATKRLLWQGLGAAVEARLAEEARVVAELSGTADAREGLAAVLERRAPAYTGR